MENWKWKLSQKDLDACKRSGLFLDPMMKKEGQVIKLYN